MQSCLKAQKQQCLKRKKKKKKVGGRVSITHAIPQEFFLSRKDFSKKTTVLKPLSVLARKNVKRDNVHPQAGSWIVLQKTLGFSVCEKSWFEFSDFYCPVKSVLSDCTF